VAAEYGVREADDHIVAFGQDRAGARVGHGEAAGPQVAEEARGLLVEEDIGVGAAIVPSPAVGVQGGDRRCVTRAGGAVDKSGGGGRVRHEAP